MPTTRHRRHPVSPAVGTVGLGGFRSAAPFLVVGLVLYGLFVVVPVVQTVALSFVKWKGFGDPVFVGLNNYVILVTTDPVFPTAFRNSIVWTALTVIVPNAIGLLLAVVLNSRIRGRVVFRAAFYLPAVLATLVVAMTWNGVYDPLNGLLNDLLEGIGLAALIQPWLGPTTGLLAVFVASVWHGTGISMILFLAGLQMVRPDLIDAAKVDGATRVRVFWHIELPALRPTIVVVVLLSIIGGLKAFDLIYAMTNGGPANTTQVLASYAWTTALSHHTVGLGSAVATVLFLLSAIFVLPYLRWTFRDWGGEHR